MRPLYVLGSEATQIAEIAPGVWFPLQTSTQTFDETKLWKDQSVVAFVRQHTFDKVQLDPKHEPSLFSEVRIPEGARVHTVKDGKIIKTHVAEAP